MTKSSVLCSDTIPYAHEIAYASWKSDDLCMSKHINSNRCGSYCCTVRFTKLKTEHLWNVSRVTKQLTTNHSKSKPMKCYESVETVEWNGAKWVQQAYRTFSLTDTTLFTYNPESIGTFGLVLYESACISYPQSVFHCLVYCFRSNRRAPGKLMEHEIHRSFCTFGHGGRCVRCPSSTSRPFR